MSFIDRLLGRGDSEPANEAPRQSRGFASDAPQDEDARAIERYRYLLKTAPPETIEQAHTEAFSRLTPEQRQMVLQELTQDLPENERTAAASAGDDPRALARTATRAEMRDPGTLERSFSRFSPAGGGIGMGGLIGGTFLSSFAGIMIGTTVADAFFNDSGQDQGSSGGDESGGDESADQADASGDTADSGAAGDTGGDFGAGDLGGSDFGGGDFGGGDFGGGGDF